MRRVLAGTPVIVALLLCATQASEGPPPPITRATLVGIWEAAPSWAQRVYRLEIAARGESYLAFTLGSEDLVFRLTSLSVSSGGRVTLRFRSLKDRGRRGANDLQITGKGYSDGQFGTFAGTLQMRYAYHDESVEKMAISFTMPPWTRDLPQLSKHSERLIQAAKARR